MSDERMKEPVTSDSHTTSAVSSRKMAIEAVITKKTSAATKERPKFFCYPSP